MCLFFKYPEALPLKRVDMESVVEGLMEIISKHGLPGTVLKDQGSVFMSGVFKKICDTRASLKSVLPRTILRAMVLLRGGTLVLRI